MCRHLLSDSCLKNNNNFKHVGFNGLWELNFLEDDNELEYGLCVSLGMRP